MVGPENPLRGPGQRGILFPRLRSGSSRLWGYRFIGSPCNLSSAVVRQVIVEQHDVDALLGEHRKGSSTSHSRIAGATCTVRRLRCPSDPPHIPDRLLSPPQGALKDPF